MTRLTRFTLIFGSEKWEKGASLNSNLYRFLHQEVWRLLLNFKSFLPECTATRRLKQLQSH